MGLTSFLYRNVLDPFTTVVAHPIKSISAAISPNKTFKEVVANTIAEPKAQQIGEVITTGLTVGSILGATKAVVTKGISKVASSLIPSTTKGKVIAAVAAPAVISAVASNPKIISEAATIPSKSAAFGADVGKFTAEPSVENALNIVKENPLISGIVAGGAVLAGGGALLTGAGALENIKTRESVVDLTNALENQAVSNLPTSSSTSKEVSTTQKPFAPSTAVTAATAPLTRSTTRKRKKVAKETPSINQRVNVIVQNKSSSVGIKQSKNYLKRSILA